MVSLEKPRSSVEIQRLERRKKYVRNDTVTSEREKPALKKPTRPVRLCRFTPSIQIQKAAMWFESRP